VLVFVLALAAELFLLTWAAAPAAPASQDDGMPAFEAYLERFNKSYDSDEMERRRVIYNETLKEIAELNSRPGTLWTAGVNKFTDATPEERARQRVPGAMRLRSSVAAGALRGPGAMRLRSSLAATSMERLPKTVDWRHIAGKIRDDSNCGGCWALAAASALDAHIRKATGMHIDVSEQELIDCTYGSHGGNSCSKGGTSPEAFQYAVHHGVAEAKHYPFVSARSGHQGTCKLGHGVEPVAGIRGWEQVEANNVFALMEAVARVGPIAVGIDASKHWDFYQGGILDTCDHHHMVVDHDALLVGYGEEHGVKYWLVQNGWGSDWGEAGFIRIKRHHRKICARDSEEKNQLDCGECGILSDPVYPIGAYLKQQQQQQQQQHRHNHRSSLGNGNGHSNHSNHHSSHSHDRGNHDGSHGHSHSSHGHSRRLVDDSLPVIV
jgi:cathepsin L